MHVLNLRQITLQKLLNQLLDFQDNIRQNAGLFHVFFQYHCLISGLFRA